MQILRLLLSTVALPAAEEKSALSLVSMGLNGDLGRGWDPKVRRVAELKEMGVSELAFVSGSGHQSNQLVSQRLPC